MTPGSAPLSLYPRWLRGALLSVALLHDVAIFVAAVGAFNFTPPSVARALVPDWLFVGMLMVGALAGIVGAVTRKSIIEMVGVVLMAFGMFTWAVSAFTQPMPTPYSFTVGAAFFAEGFALLWRGFGVLVGVFLRVRN